MDINGASAPAKCPPVKGVSAMQTPHSVAVMLRRVLAKDNLGPIEDRPGAVTFAVRFDNGPPETRQVYRVTVEPWTGKQRRKAA